MKLLFKGHDARYAVEQSLLAFFPQERPVYDPAAREENQATVTLSQGKKYITAVTMVPPGRGGSAGRDRSSMSSIRRGLRYNHRFPHSGSVQSPSRRDRLRWIWSAPSPFHQS